jgi:hypothetical protein
MGVPNGIRHPLPSFGACQTWVPKPFPAFGRPQTNHQGITMNEEPSIEERTRNLELWLHKQARARIDAIANWLAQTPDTTDPKRLMAGRMLGHAVTNHLAVSEALGVQP